MDAVRHLRDRLEAGIRETVPGARLNGHPTERLANTLNMVLPGYRGESIVLALDRRGISLSSGSACHSGSPAPSHVLLAMGLSAEDAHCSVRMTLGAHTTDEDIDRALEAFRDLLHGPGEIIRFVACR
ncbi:MAG TPA: aminotransferase class V-fold PLP-dependent enzyme, partial [Methanoculleus sp.]|nr:aminotransferase class V-fold PLP-dependent enzyme [Methanoculleus sp.]